MLLLQLQHTTHTMHSSNKGYKTTNLYIGVMGELKKMKKTAINERIFIEIGICVWEGKVMATGSERKQCGRYTAVEEGNVGRGLKQFFVNCNVCITKRHIFILWWNRTRTAGITT